MSSSCPSRLSRPRRILAAVAVLALAGLTPLVTSGGAPPAAAADAGPLARPAGYWFVASDGGIFAYGGARFLGSTGAIKLNQPIVGMAATPSGNGYWLVASDGGIFSFGDAGFFGSTGAIKLNKPITGMSPSATGHGYRMVATDGGLFSFGDAAFFGSTGGTALAKPISGMAPTPSGKGYWLVASGGAIFPFGDAAALGAASSLRSVAAMAPSPTGAGYWEVGGDGSLAAFGDAVDLGHPSGALTRPIVGMAVLSPSAAATTPTTTGGPASDPSTATTSTTAPTAQSGSPLYASHALDGTYGTPPQSIVDPSHPARVLCYQPPCTAQNATYAEEIRAIAQAGNRLFIGGFFHNLVQLSASAPGAPASPVTPFLAELDATTGQPIPGSAFATNAAPDLTVESLAVSPDGRRLYAGGRFAHIGGRAIARFAALDLRTGLLDPTFTPPTPDDSVHTIVASGDRVYFGGSFQHVGSTARGGVAAVNAADGSLTTAFVPPAHYPGSFKGQAGLPAQTAPGVVYAMSVAGQCVIVGGDFLHFGTTAAADPYNQQSGLIALNVSDGSLSSWHPHSNRPVFQIALSPDGNTVYNAEGGAGGALLTYTLATNEPLWTGHVDGDALGVAATDKRVYVGGHFDVEEEDPSAPCLHVAPTICIGQPGSTKHRHLVAFNLDGHVDNTFTAQADTPEGPSVMLVGPQGLYVGGNFQNTLDKHVDDGGVRIFHPGFALFPAIR